MDLEVLKKKLSTYRGEGGRVTKVSDDLLLEILSAWENWTGSAHSFYTAIGSNQKKMACPDRSHITAPLAAVVYQPG